ncbi:hypothetical protein VKS41_005662 [Umbelopsis sp. WA50703]
MARHYEPRGWLVKLSSGTLRKTWNRRYFVLSDYELRYYRQENDTHPAGMINLNDYHYAYPENIKKLPYAFSILSKDRTRRPYVLNAENTQDMMIWLESLRTVFKDRDLSDRRATSNLSAHNTDTMDDVSDSVLDKWLYRLDLDDSPRGKDSDSIGPLSVSSWTEGMSTASTPHTSRRSTESLASSVQSDSASSVLSSSSSGTDMSQISSPTSPTLRKSIAKLPTQPSSPTISQDMSRTRVRVNRYTSKSVHTSSVSPPSMNSFLTQAPVASHMGSATNIDQNPFFNPRIPPRNRNRLPANDKRSPPSSPRTFLRPDSILPAGSSNDVDASNSLVRKRSIVSAIDNIP